MSKKTITTIRLKDQFDSRKISPRDFEGYYRNNSNFFVNDFITANQVSLNELSISCTPTFEQDRVSLTLRPNGVIGAIPLRNPITYKVFGGLVVEPRFGWSGYGPLLKAIGWAATPKILPLPMVPGSSREIPPWVIASPLIVRLTRLLRNLNRGFEIVNEIRSSPRGKIIWNDYINNSIPKGNYHKLPCMFPDLGSNDLLRAYIKWSLEKIRSSLNNVQQIDHFSTFLIGLIDNMQIMLRDVPIRIPSKSSLYLLEKQNKLSSRDFIEGIAAINWIIDEKGLAGSRENEGISWKLSMSELFESWVETVATEWAANFGGVVTTSRKETSRVPIHWTNNTYKSLSTLAPDIVIETQDTVYIIDAKYKSFFEELDDQKWKELSDNIRDEHRHDLHQIIAYSTLFNKKRIVSLLAYPLTRSTYEKLSDRGRVISRAVIPIENKSLELGIFGLSLSLGETTKVRDLSEQLDPLLIPLAY